LVVQIVLDTNIPILVLTSSFSLESEIDRLIPQKHSIIFLSACVTELDFISKKSAKLAKQAAFARKFIERYKIVEFDPQNIRYVDDKIVHYAKENRPNCVVVTNDKELRQKLREIEIPVIFIRTRGHLELLGSV